MVAATTAPANRLVNLMRVSFRMPLYDNTTISPETPQMGSPAVDARSWHRFDAPALQGFAEELLPRGGLADAQARDID
jgi:hypothetical protein